MKWNIPIAIAATILNSALAIYLGFAGPSFVLMPVLTVLLAPAVRQTLIHGLYYAAYGTFAVAAMAVITTIPLAGLIAVLPELTIVLLPQVAYLAMIAHRIMSAKIPPSE